MCTDGVVFANTAMLLMNFPGRPSGSNMAVIVPLWPGAIGSFFHSHDVQSQPVLISLITSGAVPLFVYVNLYST